MICCQDKKNIVLCDCEQEEIFDIVDELQNVMKVSFEIGSCICNEGAGRLLNIKRYITYILYPLKYFLRRDNYKYVIGWQQFFALFFSFYCRIFHLKKKNIVVALNFTYKKKKGIIGRVYKAYMEYCLDSKYMDYIHVPSENYAKLCANEFNIPFSKFIVTTFGLPDTYSQWKNSKVDYNNYSFSIGRSNRDFDFLIEAWKKMPSNELLVIASDSYKTKSNLPQNIIHRRDICGDRQFPYIANCKMMIIPIDDGTICSGDTVLLKAMSYERAVVVTSPSTLAEMYVEDNVNGILVEKEIDNFVSIVSNLINNPIKMEKLGIAARKYYKEFFSRRSMGRKIAESINNKE